MEHRIKSLLYRLQLSTEESLVPFYPQVRDRDDLAVLKCLRSGVLILSRSDHIDLSHYERKQHFKYWGAQDRQSAILSSYEDSERRCRQFKHAVTNKKWLDVGTGAGGILDQLAPLARETLAVEPQEEARRALTGMGYRIYPSVEQVPDHDLEVVTLFHVLEHLTDPIGTLTALRERMAPGARLIVEVPHARDFLLSFLEVEEFKAFTFWSEHLILHTRESLERFLEAAGFTEVAITGFQRYPLANHLHWLAKSRPGGHKVWDCLRTQELDAAYGSMLAGLDYTDTLIAAATCIESA